MRMWIPLAAALLASTVQAEPLTYAAALRLAESAAPTLQASALRIDAAQATEQAAGRLPDPKLSLGMENVPVSGPYAGRWDAAEMTMARVGLMQEVPNAGRRRAATATAQAETQMAIADTDLQRRRVRVATALAWIDLAYAERRLAVLDQLVDGLKPLWEGLSAGVESGSARPAAGLEPTRLRAEFDNRRSALVAEVTQARASLTRWTGAVNPMAAGEPPYAEIEPADLRARIADHPALQLLAAATQRAKADVAGARAARRPDWGVEVMYGRRDPMFGDMVSAAVTVSLPLFASQRQDPVIAARTAQASRARLLEADMRRELDASLEADLATYAANHDQWLRAKDVLVPIAEQMAQLEIASYSAGRADYSNLVEAFTDLADTKLAALDREALVARDGARIVLTYGSDNP
ncbi:MAG: transporter [Phenylobacterium sp.]|nr:transporter [Phenylobacterium sp.]